MVHIISATMRSIESVVGDTESSYLSNAKSIMPSASHISATIPNLYGVFGAKNHPMAELASLK